ncbi:tetratricopeptide repeat protein [Flavitalea antarctica]
MAIISKQSPFIFLSYSRKNRIEAEVIEDDFMKLGVFLTRDTREVRFKDNIKAFMKGITEADFTIMLISDDFLQSKWCMFEVAELLESGSFNQKALPILLSHGSATDRETMKEKTYLFWKDKLVKVDGNGKRSPASDTKNAKDTYTRIYQTLDAFFTAIDDINVSTLADLRLQNYKDIMELIGFADVEIMEEAMKIKLLTDLEDREIALENFGKKYPFNPHYLFLKAFIARESKQFKVAKFYFEKAITHNQDNPIGYYNLGRLLQHDLDDFEAAIFNYEKAIKLFPRMAIAYVNLGALHSHLGNWEKGKWHYQEALKIDPYLPEAMVNLAGIFFEHEKNLMEAERLYQKAMALTPNDPDIYYYLGMIARKQANNETAREYYEQVLEIDPDYYQAHLRLAEIFYALENFQEAIDHFEKYLNFQPADYKVRSNLASAFYRMHEYEKALKHYYHALEVCPSSESIHNNLSILMDQTGNWNEAKLHCEATIKLNPLNADAHFRLGRIYRDHFQLSDQAEFHFNAVLRINPNDERAQVGLGFLHLDLQSSAKALSYFRKTLLLNKKNAVAHFGLARVFDFMGDRTKAKEHLQLALSIDPFYIDAHINLGVFLRDSQDFEGARLHFEEALRLDPLNAATHFKMMHLLLMHLNDRQGAKLHYIKAKEIDAKFGRKFLDKQFHLVGRRWFQGWRSFFKRKQEEG